MTETEAKTKWCPMLGQVNSISAHCDHNGNAHAYCIGSACMMFRREKTHIAAMDKDGTPVGATIDRVYCGLAGKQ